LQEDYNFDGISSSAFVSFISFKYDVTENVKNLSDDKNQEENVNAWFYLICNNKNRYQCVSGTSDFQENNKQILLKFDKYLSSKSIDAISEFCQ